MKILAQKKGEVTQLYWRKVFIYYRIGTNLSYIIKVRYQLYFPGQPISKQLKIYSKINNKLTKIVYQKKFFYTKEDNSGRIEE